MKLYKKILFLGCLAGGLAACNDLEIDESQYHTTKFLFSDFSRVAMGITNVYACLPDELSVLGTLRDCATDDAVYAWSADPVKTFYDGSWSANRLIDDQWAHYYSAIRSANYFLENCPDDFPNSKWTTNYEQNLKELRYYPWEAKVLRAYFHFELLRRYNQIIIADRTFTIEEVNHLKPVSYQEAADWIVKELEPCIKVLPETWKDTPSAKLGRVTKGFCMALKARVLLYAASPLNNPSGNSSEWAKAAEAAKELMDANIYKLVDEQVFNNENAQGLIFGRRLSAGNQFEYANFPVGMGGNSGVCPSENLVEAFDMADGTPFSWEQHQEDVLDPSKRDPRFAKTLLANGMSFKNDLIESFDGGRNGAPQDGASPTSYYLRKLLQEDTNIDEGTGTITSFGHIFPMFRYAEVYLNYAEALFEATGNPNFTGDWDGKRYDMSPVAAVNAIRARSFMQGLDENIDETLFRTRLRNERRVELAFENHRFWDIRRWKIGNQTVKIYGLRLSKDANDVITKEKYLVQERVWDDKMNYYPIGNGEMNRNENLIQNTDW